MSRSSSRVSESQSKPRSSSSSNSPPSQSTLKRLTRELSELNSSPNDAVLHLGPVNDSDLFQWEAVLKGPREPSSSPYAGGLWLLSITIPSSSSSSSSSGSASGRISGTNGGGGGTYPNIPPRVRFVTPICHPNIHFSTGEICLTLLTSEHWSPSYTVSSTMSAIQQLLADPTGGLDSPLNVDIANLYRDGDDLGAEGLTRYWTAEKRWAGEGKAGWITEKRSGPSGARR